VSALPIIIPINGILTGQVAVSWVDEFFTWCDRERVPALVLKREYFAHAVPALNRFWFNYKQAQAVVNEVALLCREENRELHFVAHSNGTDIAVKAIRKLAAQDIPTTSLIVCGSVLQPDLKKNGLLELLEREDLTRAYCYCSSSDRALRFGRWSAYSEAGRKGFRLDGESVNNIPALNGSSENAPLLCLNRWFPGYGHGDYFAPQHREHTFQLFRKDMGL
jgi:hypothetical protein